MRIGLHRNADAPIAITDFTYPGKNTWTFVFRGVQTGPGTLTFFAAPSLQSCGTADYDSGSGYVPTSFDSDYGGFLTVKYYLPTFFNLKGETEFYFSGSFGSGANQHADTDLDNCAVSDYSVFAGVQGFALVSNTIS